VREYVEERRRLVTSLEDIIDRETVTPVTNLIREMLQVNSRARLSSQELKMLFNILVDNTPITALKDDNSLYSKINQSLSEDDESDTNRNTM